MADLTPRAWLFGPERDDRIDRVARRVGSHAAASATVPSVTAVRIIVA